jgi:hypothetical protein
LAAVFEIGGYVSFIAGIKNAENGRRYIQSGPVLGLQNADSQKINRLKILFDGCAFPSDSPNKWQIVGKRAGWMLEQMSPYMPSHKCLLEEVQKWNATRNIWEAYDIASAAKGRERNFTIQPSFYRRLVTDPLYMGGLTAFRGNEGTRLEDNDVVSPRVVYNSTNLGVIQAIKARFHGSMQLHKAGKLMEIDGKRSVLTHDSQELYLVGNDARFLLQFVKRDTLVKDEDIQELLAIVA